jgi:hypothetical protein
MGCLLREGRACSEQVPGTLVAACLQQHAVSWAGLSTAALGTFAAKAHLWQRQQAARNSSKCARGQGGFSDAVEDANPAVGDELRLWLKPKSTPGGATLTVAFWRDGAPLAREAKEEGPAAEAAEAATLASGLVASAMRQAVESADGAASAPPQQAAAKEITAAEPAPAPASAVVDTAALVADAAAEAVEEENEAAAQQAAGQEEEEEHGMKAIGHAIEHAFEAIEHAIVATMHKDR